MPNLVCTLLFCTATLYLVTATEFTISEKCSKCRKISNQFKDGLLKTAKSNFGGGNTDWEEKKLKGFAASETRLIEIIEPMCDSDKFCSLFLENQEETIENWWFRNADLLRKGSTTEESAAKIASILEEFLCIKETSVCCPNGTYGPNCTPCPSAISGIPCSGKGKCDGDGTRSGSGKCSCNVGYVGDLCSSCATGYFSDSDNDDEVVCTSCETNCAECNSAGPGKCSKCHSGYILSNSGDETGRCLDIDECDTEVSPCVSPSTYCQNIPGSYKCVSCDKSCDEEGCRGSGPGACIGGCSTGYKKVEDGDISRCEDVDECTEAEELGKNLCGSANEGVSPTPVCINTPGSFKCGCSEEGYEFNEGTCSLPKADEDGEADAKTKYKEPKKRKNKGDKQKPLSNKSSKPKVASSLETDFNLIHFCLILVVSIVVISFLASKPRPWPAVSAILLVLTAIYVYYYVGAHEPRASDSGKSKHK